ncbi:MAG TPA: hypothetical protein VMT16_14980 [Thermoanaerobaculia bacterium]|nr:hypothetical protein [Thermoanaerobaculia bacterium]
MSWPISGPRHLWIAFPLFMTLAHVTNRWAFLASVACFTAGLLHFARIFTTGNWAF